MQFYGRGLRISESPRRTPADNDMMFQLPPMPATDDPKSKRNLDGNRRRNARARISLPIRVRSADFADDHVDEVRATVNVSRGGVYFSSQRISYRPGMRVLLTILCKDFAGAGPEEPGEVVLVGHLKDGRAGVAIRLIISTEI